MLNEQDDVVEDDGDAAPPTEPTTRSLVSFEDAELVAELGRRLASRRDKSGLAALIAELR